MTIAPGFDPKWKTFPDFILGMTREIWEDRGIATLKQYYGPDLVVRSPASVVVGNDGIIAATRETLAEFPDRQLPGEDVIWCDDDGLMSSHRLLCTATHSGAGRYGPPTGQRLTYRILADCYCAENQVRDEWLVRDQGAIVRQMGFDLTEWTRDLIRREGGPNHCTLPLTPETDLEGPYRGRGNDHEMGQALADILTQIMQADFAIITERYDRACALHYPGHVTDYGHGVADRFWLSLRSAFPSARFQIAHRIGRNDPLLPPRAAIRWSLNGRHDGWGMFGKPSHAQIHVMGITHVEFGPRGITKEWTLIDETAILKQILLATGDV
ncbi:ester cyclase [Actibacterium sp. 188UL27-1]|uniref:nuclear transport factor 2 family protein n=1 Tax=Actibacterium sp. 188UL27-1 TaxID=2786961 RepID=UPI00195D2BD2|nr:ester cyclase [Actibacterium sp. 188UL27-1]MBM7069673.1 ester cyclase [Actibacterium sp. 188UL27-1]